MPPSIPNQILTPIRKGLPQLIDAHGHLIPGIAVETIISLMDQAGVQYVVLMANRIASRPIGWEDTMVLHAYERYPKRIIPFLSTPRYGYGAQFGEASIIEYVENQLRTGKFKGMGEFMVRHYACAPPHFAPDISVPADSPFMQQMMRLGTKYNVPLTIHMETTPHTVKELDCALTANKNTRVIWAHQNPVKTSGGSEEEFARQGDPNQIAALLDKHPRLFADISVGYETYFFKPEDRQLPTAWKFLYENYNDRFVVGFDSATETMYNNYLPRASVIRGWLSQLSSNTVKKLAYENIPAISSF